MEVHFPPELEAKLTYSAAKQGRAADELVQDVLARYLADEARFFEIVESWTDAERRAAMSHIEQGFLQAARGDLTDGAQAREEIQLLKDNWRDERSPAR
ncbi:MAG TPA: hypothetical protein VHY84_16600 [Bryobacteraceae bacterium]|jgi:hypothetical protein|nr:hypothetical protein [Bryobacteraceae bacterium]